jgi:hypothetical protein
VTGPARPRPPAGLGRAGRKLFSGLVAKFVFAPRELAIVELAARTADDIADLEAALARDGMVVVGSKGQPRLNGVAVELRMARLALAKLLGDLRLPDEDEGAGSKPMSMAQLRGQRAANTRWAADARRKARRRGSTS